MTADHDASLPDDDALGRLLADGLHRGADRPVDGDVLVAGATAGARRIRRRRSALAGAAALVLVGSGVAWFSQSSTGTATNASSAEATLAAAPAVPGAARGQAGTDAAGSAAKDAAGSDAAGSGGTGSAGPVHAGSATAGPVPPGPATPLAVTVPPPGAPQAPHPSVGGTAVPGTALLRIEDVMSLMGAFASTTANNGEVPALTPADVCGVPLPAPPPQAGARGVDWRGRVAVESVVRVLPGDGAGSYAAALLAQPCLRRTSGAFDEGGYGHGPADAQGQVRWFALARAGRTLVEVRVVVPTGDGTGAADVAALLATAVRRDAALARQAAADPALD